jgi:DNA-binding GntR family transcriptional regulator
MARAQQSYRTLDFSIAVGPQLHRMLRDRIVRNSLEPGARVSESEIAAEYSVSRQPVREAFIKLAEEGLVEVRPQRGTFVRKISRAAVMDARFVREAIEADIVKLLAERQSSELITELRLHIGAQAAAATANTPLRFLELDERFHRTLAEEAGKSYAWSVVEGVKVQMDRVRHLSAAHFPMNKLVEQHRQVVEAIASGDAVAADTQMRMHLREIVTDLPAIAASRPEYFEDRDLA